MCFGIASTGPPEADFSPERLRGAPGGQDPGSLQIKENDVYMREGCCSSYDPSEGRAPGEPLPDRAAPGAG